MIWGCMVYIMSEVVRVVGAEDETRCVGYGGSERCGGVSGISCNKKAPRVRVNRSVKNGQ